MQLVEYYSIYSDTIGNVGNVFDPKTVYNAYIGCINM